MNMPVVGGEDQPHLTVQTRDGNVHVLPESLIQDVIDGKMEFTEIEAWRPLLQAILADWLATLKHDE